MSSLKSILKSAHSSTNTDEIKELVKAALQTQESDHQSWVEFGDICNTNQWQLAHQCFKRAVAADPNDAVSWFKLGLIDKAMGHKKEAIDHLTQSIELKINAEVLEIRSELYLETGHVQLAKEDSEAATCQKKEQCKEGSMVPESWLKLTYH